MRGVRYPVLSIIRNDVFCVREGERTSFSMSFNTLGFSAISMYTVPTTQQSSPCLTSSTRSTKVAFCPPNLYDVSIPLYHEVCIPTPTACYCIPRSRSTHLQLSASPSSSIALTAKSTYRRIVANSGARYPVVARSRVADCTPNGFETVRAAHPHCCGQYRASK